MKMHDFSNLWLYNLVKKYIKINLRDWKIEERFYDLVNKKSKKR